MTAPPNRDSADTLARLRDFVLVIFVAGAIGTGSELVLLGHFEDVWQWVPLALLPASLLVVVWHRVERAHLSTRVLQGTMGLCVASGVAGLWFHYAGNAAFELEMYPSLAGWDLVREALAGATPALAPATMIQLGLLGLTYTYRHPFLEREVRVPRFSERDSQKMRSVTMEKKMTMPMSRCRVCAFWGLAIWLGLSSAAGAQVAQHTGVLNPNIAGETEIAALAGVSPALAARIVANRPFLTMAAFDHLVAASLGERTQREALYARLFVPINLNTASEAEILLVPGVGNRLAHEFEEYRPYRDGAVQTRDRQVRR